MSNPIVTTLVVACLTASVILISTKHNVISLAPSIVACFLVVIALLPGESGEGATTYAYSPGGGVRVRKQGQQPKRARVRRPSRVAHTHPPPAPHQPPAPMSVQSPSMPVCAPRPAQPSNQEMKNYIRDNGLYGVHGNLSCKRLQRGTVADSGLLQPLNARNQLLKFLSVDQQHAKDPYLIPRK